MCLWHRLLCARISFLCELLATYLPTFTHPLCLSFHFFVGLWVLQSFKWIRRAVTKSIHLSSIVRLPFSSLYLFISSLHSCSFYHTVWLCLVVKSYFCLSSIFLRPFSFYHTVSCRGVFFCLFFCRHSLVCLFVQFVHLLLVTNTLPASRREVFIRFVPLYSFLQCLFLYGELHLN